MASEKIIYRIDGFGLVCATSPDGVHPMSAARDALIAAIDEDRAELVADNGALRTAARALVDTAYHYSKCPAALDHGNPCACGLAEARRVLLALLDEKICHG